MCRGATNNVSISAPVNLRIKHVIFFFKAKQKNYTNNTKEFYFQGRHGLTLEQEEMKKYKKENTGRLIHGQCS